jgi:hypothetical protein
MSVAVRRQLAATGHRRIASEKYYGSKAVDVVAETGSGALVGFECAVHITNVVDNLVKDFLAQPRFSLITTVCLGQSDVRQAQHAVASAPSLHPYRTRLCVVALARFF